MLINAVSVIGVQLVHEGVREILQLRPGGPEGNAGR